MKNNFQPQTPNKKSLREINFSFNKSTDKALAMSVLFEAMDSILDDEKQIIGGNNNEPMSKQ